jgi:leader peptidase (prepilin peptidase)/N-methyltransferase
MVGWLSDFGMILVAPAFGSFLALLVDRLPRGERVIFSRSYCRSCRHPLGPAELVPIFSRAWQRGRCRWCGDNLPLQDLLIEISALGVAIWAIAASQPTIPTAALGWSLLALAAIDLRHMLLPDAITFPLMLGGLTLSALSNPPWLLGSIAGVALGGSALLVVSFLYLRLKGRDGLGLGDVKLFAAGGAWVGWQGLPGVLLIAALSALLYAVIDGRLTKLRGRPLPFGPFLAAGIWLIWLNGPIAL